MSDPGQPPPGGWAPIRPAGGDGAAAPPPLPPPPSAPYQPPVGSHGQPQGVSAAPVYGGGGGAGGGKEPKRVRPASTGRRAPSFALVGGLGLLGLLITIAIMAVLANTVLSGTDDAADVLGGALPTDLTTSVPGETTVPGQGADDGASTGGLSNLGEPSSAAVCQVNRGVLEVAAQAYEISFGSVPADQQQMLDSGVLTEPVPNFTVSAGPDGAVITGEGACTGL